MSVNPGGAAAPVRHGGAPLNNQNARQHGLYSRRSPLPPAEQISALRAYIAQLLARAAAFQSPRDVALALRRLTTASLALNRLIRAQLFAPPPPPPPPAPGFGYPQASAPHSSPSSTRRLSFSAPFPFVHPVLLNLVHMLMPQSPNGSSP
jgi:hypothetical protein